MTFLEKVNSPADLKKLSLRELEAYAEEVREYIISVVGKNGGHLASNLGAVDFTVALHYVFDCPTDKIVFDVGHQSYAHKIITGRAKAFENLRRTGGITGFENMRESKCDAFSTGHSSTSLSVGLGLARARDLAGDDYNVVAVIGDGALTGGMAYEALNDIGASGTRIIIVLNDNKMSISENVGAISAYLGKLRMNKRYRALKTTFKRGIDGIPLLGPTLVKAADKVKRFLKRQFITNKMFEQLGIRYFGTFDGHNIAETVEMFSELKHSDGPVLLHLITNKGNGLYEAERDPEKYHGVEGSHDNIRKFSAVVSSKLREMAARDDKVVAVSAAMLSGTGLSEMHAEYPDRCFDVGIAEEHAVAMCAGMAAAGLKPYFAVYSTFLQRGYDQLIHDVCLNDLPVRFLIDRAGVVGADGATHQGVFDLSYLGMIPNMTIMAPMGGKELEAMLEWSLTFDGPLAIRYPKGYADDRDPGKIELGKWQVIRDEGSLVTVLAVGERMARVAWLSDCDIVNARFVKPLDTAMLDELAARGVLVVTMEDNMLRGGFGESVRAYYAERGIACDVRCMGYGDAFREELSVGEAMEEAGLTTEKLDEIIQERRLSQKNS